MLIISLNGSRLSLDDLAEIICSSAIVHFADDCDCFHAAQAIAASVIYLIQPVETEYLNSTLLCNSKVSEMDCIVMCLVDQLRASGFRVTSNLVDGSEILKKEHPEFFNIEYYSK